MVARECEARAIASGKQPVLAALATAPDRANGVDHVTRRQPEAWRDLGISRLAALELGAGRAKLRAREAVDRAVIATSTELCPIGCVDDGVDVEPRDVAFDDRDSVKHGCIADGTTP